VTGALADDHGELALVVEALRGSRPLQRSPVAHHAVGETHEHHRVLRPLAAHFLHVRHVVDADAEQLDRGVGDRRQQCQAGEGVIGLFALELAQLGQCARVQQVAQTAVFGAQTLAGVDDAVAAHQAVARTPIDLEAD
jgi:hypothetical protein